MANSDFNPNKDINRYLSQQGRAPQSHFDWETWRKVGQPGTYQAPPGGGPMFRGVRGGVGGPNYNADTNHYNMFAKTGDAIAKTLAGPTAWMQNKFDKMGNSTGINESQELELGIKGGHQFVYGRVGLRTDLGIYVLRPILSDKPFFYNAIGIDCRLSQDWVLRSRLKAHLNVADYMEFGLSRLF